MVQRSLSWRPRSSRRDPAQADLNCCRTLAVGDRFPAHSYRTHMIAPRLEQPFPMSGFAHSRDQLASDRSVVSAVETEGRAQLRQDFSERWS